MSRILFFVLMLTVSLGLKAGAPTPSYPLQVNEQAASIGRQPTEKRRSKVCLNMIVKNEAHVIERCLESVLPLIDCWAISDTGSTDGTQEVIRNFFNSRGIPGELFERPWINFAHNRNEAFELGRDLEIDGEKADYLLFMDADDILTYDPNYVRPNLLDKGSYYIRIFYSGTTYDRVQLVQTSLPWKWIGVVHEVIVCEQNHPFAYLDGVTMKIIGGGGRSKDPNKFLKDAEMLEADLQKDPDNSRTVFYLAQSYRDAECFEKSIEWYQKRVDMGGWNEEVFWSLYQIANLQERLKYDRETILASYAKAFMYRPSRAEPLYRASVCQRQHKLPYHAFLLADLALKIQKPHDLIFVEDWVYEFGLLFEYSVSALQVGLFQECFNACLKLLAKPDLPDDFRKATEHNLSIVVQLINQYYPAKAS